MIRSSACLVEGKSQVGVAMDTDKGCEAASMNLKQRLMAHHKIQPAPLCVGVDPHLDKLLRLVRQEGFMDRGPSMLRSPAYYMRWFGESLLAAAVRCEVGVVKFQLACFEVLGARGWAELEELVKLARAAGMYVILDGKWGDIQSTMRAYGEMIYERMEAHSATINPYMGRDVWLAWKPWLQGERSVYVVWRTSNPSASEFQEHGSPALADLILQRLLESFAEHDMMASLGLVVGAGPLARLTQDAAQLIAQTPLLIPGLGAQGGGAGQGHVVPKPWQIWNVSRGLYAETDPALQDEHSRAESPPDDLMEIFEQRIKFFQRYLNRLLL